jgi:hypothetical protein
LGSDWTLDWIRRTRIEGDSWDLPEVALGEETEQYRVRVLRGATLLREIWVSSPTWSYSAAEQTTDGVASGDQIEVAQLSARFGAGLAAELIVP